MRQGFRVPGLFVLAGSLLLTLVSATSSQGAANVIDPNQGWSLPDDSGMLGSENGLFTERSSQDRDYSALLDTEKLGQNQLDPTCTSLSDANCSQSHQFIYYAQLPVCQSAEENNCLDSLSAIDSTGKVYPATFSRYFPKQAQNQYQGDPAKNLPSGGPGSIFSIPGAEGPAGNLFYVSFIMSGDVISGSPANLRSVHASIVPVQLQEDKRFDNWSFCLSPSKTCDTGWNKLDAGGGKFIWNESGSQGTNCAETSWAEKLCAEKEAFPNSFSYSLKVRLSLSPAGWLHGRMTNPDISIVKNGNSTELTVTAAPVSVPTIYKHYQWSDMPADLQALYDPTTGKYRNSGGEGFSRTIIIGPNPAERAWTTAPSPYSQTAIAELNAWLPSVNNTATVVPTHWSFRSLTQGELQSANKCFTDPSRLNGIVTTNSTVYSPGPPEFDKNQGNLNYRVAAPHYLPGGKDTFKGTYDLVMQSVVARCIYGFSNAPIKGTVSVISASGDPQVATTIVNERNGWLRLSAYNFEFSSPTVSVSLSQEAVAAVANPAPSAAPAVQSIPPVTSTKTKAVTITCAKGKITKKVTAAKPTCPAGYKKK